MNKKLMAVAVAGALTAVVTAVFGFAVAGAVLTIRARRSADSQPDERLISRQKG